VSICTVSATTVFLAALVTALATGLGALPFFFVHDVRPSRLGLADTAAGGFMLAASTVLAWEGLRRGPFRTVAGAAAGMALIAATSALLRQRKDDLHLGSLRGADALKAVTIIAVMTVHSLSEGVGVGVSFGGGAELGAFITAAIAIHNIPEGLAISLVLVPRGTRPLAATGWSIFSSLPQPLMAVPAFLFVEAFSGVLPVGLGFAAGAMVWLVGADLLPEALETTGAGTVAVAVAGSALAMLLFLILLL
jgi:ZIP family zinc transporter